MSYLEVKNLTKTFGGLTAVHDITLAVEAGERHAILGPNGAGKSTLFHVITGELAATSGEVWLNGRSITHLPVYERANLGLGHTFQRNNLFMGLTVWENVRLAAQHKAQINRHWFKPITSFSQVSEQVETVLTQVGLLTQRDQIVSELAYGQQRAVEIALALATQPNVLLLDEPTAGMSPAETAEITHLIAALPRTLTLLIVEHDMDVIFSLADRITVLHYGQVIRSGTPGDVRNDPKVQEIYLGGF